MDGEQPTFIFELQKELDAIRENFRATASPDVVTAMDRSAEELIRAGIAERALQVGSPAPDFALPNAVGREVRLSSVTARGPSVITFYRGAW